MDLQTTRTIEAIRRRLAGMEQDLPAPASTGDVETVAGWFQTRYPGHTMPSWLTEVWARHNGVEYNGAFIYAARHDSGIDDVREVNELYVDDYPDHFMLGNADDVYMCAWRPSTNMFELLGIGDFDEADETYDTFDGLFNRIFEERMG